MIKIIIFSQRSEQKQIITYNKDLAEIEETSLISSE